MNIDTLSIAKFNELVELKDFKPPTKKEYVRYLRRLSDHFKCDPATLDSVQSLAARIAGIEVMPEFDIGFSFFPAKKDFFSVAKRRKIYQTTVQVLDLNTARCELMQQ